MGLLFFRTQVGKLNHPSADYITAIVQNDKDVLDDGDGPGCAKMMRNFRVWNVQLILAQDRSAVLAKHVGGSC